MNRSQLTADAALLFVTAVWGGTFVMVQNAVNSTPVFAFIALRFSLASLVLLPFFISNRRGLLAGRPDFRRLTTRLPRQRRQWQLLLPGAGVGLALFAGYAFQTAGLLYTTPAKAGFITGLSVVMVPIGQAIFFRQSPGRGPALGVGLATVGLALLSLQADLSVGLGDLLVLACAVSFAAHILLVGRLAPNWQPLHLAFVQIATVALLSSGVALTLERPLSLPAGNVWFAVAFTGLLATSLAFFLQSRAQQATTPTHTALIFAAEPVFAGLFSFLLIGEILGPRQIIGCTLILAGMLAAELGGKPSE